MADQWWSWALTIIGVTGFWLAGRKVWWCWYVNIVNQILWAAYAFLTEQWGFLAGTAFYMVVFVKNAYLWTFEHRYDSVIDEFDEPYIQQPGPKAGADVVGITPSESFKPPTMALDAMPQLRPTGWQQKPGCMHLGLIGAAMSIAGHPVGHEWVCQCGKKYVVVLNSDGIHKTLREKV